ncbi:MAG: 2-amino-4-hydroxy-6-hydroxymethyldihydropteridine diphosphokinase [Deltaproteobacteria bacterium]|nr:2-amino-4-hydroxy-6-hydroxymethyldihydropteridine diphosphokinase [Deltaproteobacteria bacterium]
MQRQGKHTAYIGIGSNVGDKADNCRKGIAAISECEGCKVEAQSPFYETDPVYLESQDWFINGVIRIRTDLEPEALFARLKAIEHTMGRRSGGARFGPRILDLDILFYDDRILSPGQLQIPHPNLHERRFVLRPLCDIAPELVHPVIGQNVKSLLSALKDGGKKVIQHRCDC